MAISYHVYSNDGQGGAIDYSRAIATVSAVPALPLGSFTVGPFAAPSDHLFAVRAFDDVSGVEEANTDARVRLVLDAQGRDVSNRPNAVIGLVARWTIGDVCLVSWGYSPTGQGGPPTRFVVSAVPLTGGTSSTLPAPVSVAYIPGVAGYGCRLEGLAATGDWTIQVQVVGTEDWVVGPLSAVALSHQSALLAAVDGLVAVASA